MTALVQENRPDGPVAARQPTLRELAMPSVLALRRVWVPFCLILACGVAFVVSYYWVPAVARACEGIAGLKSRFGYGFSAVGGLVAGVVVPEAFKRMTLRGHRISPRIGEIVLDAPYFIFMAVLVDGLYRMLGATLGYDVNFNTVLLKTLFDQFVFTPTLGVGIAAVYFPLRQSGWDFRRIFGGFGPAWYVRTVVPLLLPGWVFWIPAVALTYSLPQLLQMPFSLCATAAWSLLLIALSRRADSPPVTLPTPVVPTH